MKLFKKKDKRAKIDKEIETLLDTMASINPAMAEYEKMASHVKTLYEAKATMNSKKSFISGDTIMNGGFVLLEIVLIVSCEWWAPITSKAFSRITRGRG